MKPISTELIPLYDALQKHTFKDCKKFCTDIAGCCKPEYCEMAREFAAEHGVTLVDTGHPTLPFMGESGCTIEPHLRPVCTEYVCCVRDMGGRPSDPKWTAEYYELRRRILMIRLRDKR